MRKWLLSFFLFSTLHAAKVDIVSNFCLDQLSPGSKIASETGLEVRSVWPGFGEYLRTMYSDAVDKVLIMGERPDLALLSRVPIEKRISFVWEPDIDCGSGYFQSFSRVYTWNDDLVDGRRFFKFLYPVLLPMRGRALPFQERKLCTMIFYRPTPERMKMVEFFEAKPFEDFEFYGFEPTVASFRYRGAIAGHPSGEEKLSVLKKYRFSVCFENSFINGYITEKIFTAFAAGSVPVYWGAPNVESYIPKECFIDYRDFPDDEALYDYLIGVSEERYGQYIDAIGAFLGSEKAALFSPEHFNRIIRDAVLPLDSTKSANSGWPSFGE